MPPPICLSTPACWLAATVAASCYIHLDGDNSAKTATASAASKIIGDSIADEPLLLINRDCDQRHVIYPDLLGPQPLLQRMVAHRGQPARTVVQQIANLWHDCGESGKTAGEAVRSAFSVARH